jgi:hypothetical protein
MKKALIAILIVFLVLAGIIGVAWFYLPSLAFHMIGKAIGGSVEASRSTVSYRNGLLAFSFEGVKIKGRAEGRIGRCGLELLPSRGIYIKRLTASDFDLKIPKVEGRLTFYPVPVELAEIGKGLLEYGGRKYTVRELRVTNFNTGKTMKFTLDGGIEGIGDVKTHGEGIFGETRSDIKGDYSLSAVNMAFLKDYEGFVDSSGHFSYRDGKLAMDGEAHTSHMSIMETFLRRRLSTENMQCRLRAAWADNAVDLSLDGLAFDGAPLNLRIKTKGKKLTYLALVMDYVHIPELTSYLDLAALSDKDWGPFSYVQDGEVRAESFVFAKDEPLRAKIHLKNASGGHGEIVVRDAEGIFEVDGEALLLSNFRGRFGEGLIHEVSGTVPLKAGRDLKITGKYALGLKDLNRFAKEEQIEATAGSAEGSLEIQGRQGKGFAVKTSGAVRDGQFLWKGLAFRASTDYAFADRAVTFDRLLIDSGATSLAMSGRAQSGLVNLNVKGALDGRHITRLFLPDRPLVGPVDLNGHVEIQGGLFSAKGRINMTHLAFEIPGVLRKRSGMESLVSVSARGRIGGEVFVDDLQYAMGETKARARFDAASGKISNLHLTVDAPRIEDLAGLFFFGRTELRGHVRADLTVRELPYPITRLPFITGNASLTNGVLRLPSMAKAFGSIDLSCRFEGDRFVLDSSGVEAGTSLLANGYLAVEGTDAPSFSLIVDMTRFDPLDFVAKDGTSLKLPIIPEGSLMSRAKGTFIFKVHRLDVGRMTGKELFVGGRLVDRTLVVDEGRLKTEVGSISFHGDARFARVPQVWVTGELKDLTAQEAFSLFGASADALDGTGTINGTLRLAGRSGEELTSSASGTVSIVSHDGAIRKWNLVSKLLAFTNVYQLLRGRVDLSRSGLVYKKLSASFEGKDGRFHTNDFLIESPAMIIAGQGEVDAGKKTIDAKMVVSPLVEMDRLIDWIPILRSIVKEKKSGLIFFVYDVKGPVNDPKIESSYVQSVGRRGFNILWNTVRLPKSLVDRLPEIVGSFPKGLFEK